MKAEHPFTAISPAFEVHANHNNEAHNAALRRRCSAYRKEAESRRQEALAVTPTARRTTTDS